MSNPSEGQSGLWKFMLEFYALPGIAPACLRLQDAYGLDVTLFLALLQAAATGRELGAERIGMLDRECAKWRDTVVRPLRSIRRAMKADPPQLVEAQALELREDIKAVELRAERVQVDMLERLLAGLPMVASPRRAADLHSVAMLLLESAGGPHHPAPLPAEAALVADALARFAGLIER